MGGHLVVADNMDVAFPRSEIVRNQCRRPTDAYAYASVCAGRHMHMPPCFAGRTPQQGTSHHIGCILLTSGGTGNRPGVGKSLAGPSCWNVRGAEVEVAPRRQDAVLMVAAG